MTQPPFQKPPYRAEKDQYSLPPSVGSLIRGLVLQRPCTVGYLLQTSKHWFWFNLLISGTWQNKHQNQVRVPLTFEHSSVQIAYLKMPHSSQRLRPETPKPQRAAVRSLDKRAPLTIVSIKYMTPSKTSEIKQKNMAKVDYLQNKDD